MKRSLTYKILLLIPILVITLGCSSHDKTKVKKSYKEILIYGKVEVYSKNEVYIVQNWKTRSRISYRLTDKNNIKEIITKNGKVLKVKALLLEQTSPWSGKIKLLEILEESSEAK